jgi:DNA polymerase-3 subunit epsilon
MRLSHRLYPEAPGHSLEKLVRYKKLKTDGVHHRALADAEMTGHLWLSMVADLKTAYGFRHVPFELMRELATVRKSKAASFLSKAAKLQG